MAKTVNYTAENEARMVAVYTSATSDEGRSMAVKVLAGELSKPTRSIIAKLSRMGVYVKPTRTDKTGKAVVKKDAVATAIGEALSLTDADTDSLAKANKRALRVIAKALGVEVEAS